MLGGQPTKTLEHPNHPQQKLHFRKPLRSVAYEEERRYADNVTVIQIRDTDGNPLFHKSGEPHTRVVPKAPSLAELMGTVGLHVKGWDLVGGDGAPIPFTADNLRLLWDDESLDVTIVNEIDAKHEDVVAGIRPARTVTMTLGYYAFTKLQSEKFYSADPLVPDSAPAST